MPSSSPISLRPPSGGTFLQLPTIRAGLLLVLSICEILVISQLFSFEPDIPRWRHPVVLVRSVALSVIVATLIFILLQWPARAHLLARWADVAQAHSLRPPVLANVALFALLVPLTAAFTRHAADATEPPWLLFWAYCVPLSALGVSLALIAAPPAGWRELIWGERTKAMIALGVALAVLAMGELARTGWGPLAEATLVLSYSILALFDGSAGIDLDTRLLAAGQFGVTIDEACSGYEGIALVVTFLTVYLWTFRATLRFPQAFLLIPIGAATIWLLNSVRIAALVALGAHVSPDVALKGFHSQAGWIAFLIVTVAIMSLAHRVPVLAARRGEASPRSDAADDPMLAWLAPFIALMLATIVAKASAPYDHWLYGLKLLLVGAALWAFRATLLREVRRVSAISMLSGAAVGALWIATDPGSPTAAQPLAEWISQQAPHVAFAWLAMRAVGSIVMVPIAEELAFRGVLYRWVVSRDFEAVPLTTLSLAALIVSSLAFGVLHERWLAAALAGAVFALTMVRTGRIADAIASHMMANAIIVAWAIAARQWSLL